MTDFLIEENKELRRILQAERDKIIVLEKAFEEIREKVFEMAEIIENEKIQAGLQSL